MMSAPIAAQINTQEALALLKDGAILIDVREPAEFNNAHIKSANLHPLGSVSSNILASHSDKTLIIYCQKGMRGNKACSKILSETANAPIVNLSGGIEAWQKAGLSVIKGPSKTLPLDRQLHITVGTLVISFTLLSVLAHPYFVFGAMFVGAGLLFAGLTGFCGMARLLAVMPWNK